MRLSAVEGTCRSNKGHNLGRVEEENGRMDRAAKHWIIAAKLGQAVTKTAFRDGYVSKDDFEAALRGQWSQSRY